MKRFYVTVSGGLSILTPQRQLLAASLGKARRRWMWLAVLKDQVHIWDFTSSPVIPSKFTMAELLS